jgi:hypothetical protein
MESLQKALQDAQFARADLREALQDCNSVEAIIILKLIEKSVELARRIEELLNAKQADAK